MHIIHSVLHNVGPFQHREDTFTKGLLGLFGRNGVGKSTLVNTIFGCLTNDWSRFPGVKADLIHDLAGDDEEAYAEIAAVHDSQEFSLRRSFRPNSSKLKVSGEKKAITADRDIRARLTGDLGVDQKLIANYVFVGQWQLFDFIARTPSERAEAYQQLCRTGKAKRIVDACGAALSSSVFTAEVLDNSDDLLCRIRSDEVAIAQLEENRADQQKLLLNRTSLEAAQQIKRKREWYVATVGQFATTKALLATQIQEAKEREKRNDDSAAELEQAKSEVTRLEAAAVQAHTALQSWEHYTTRQKRQAWLQQETARLQQRIAAAKKPAQPAKFSQWEEMQQELTEHERVQKQSQQVVTAWERADEDARCPLCRQQIDTDFVNEQKLAGEQAVAAAATLRPMITACARYRVELTAWERQYDEDKTVLASVESELASFEELQAPTGDKAELEQTVQAYKQAKRDRDAAVTQAKACETAYVAAVTRRDETGKRVTQLQQQLSENEVADSTHEKATRRLTEHVAAEKAIAGIEGQLREKQAGLQESRQALDRLRAMMARRQKALAAGKVLSRVQDVFHWKRLPWLVAQGNLMRMENIVNDLLQELGSPYWVEADENLSFQVNFPGHPPRTVDWLSGGQRAIFAIAFRQAVNKLFNADIGTMWLDEPTAGVDEENMTFFAGALERLAAEVRGKRQIVVITHAEGLRPSFDQVIEVTR